MLKISLLLTAICVGAAVLGIKSANAQAPGQVVDLTLSGPGVEFTNVVGATTENFNSYKTGLYSSLTTSVGTFTATDGPGLAVVAANEYGAGSTSLSGTGGGGNYAAVGDSDENQSGVSGLSTTLTFTQPQTYFGAWWSALDGGNELQLYDGAAVVDTLNESSLTAVVNAQSSSKSYFGNPNGPYSGQDNAEPFAFLNFYALGNTQFTKAVFTQNSSSGDFEFDNVAIATDYSNPGINGLQVFTPEPSDLVALSIGLLGLLTLGLFKRSRSIASFHCE